MAIVSWDSWNDIARRRLPDSFFGERDSPWMPAADVTRDDGGITM